MLAVTGEAGVGKTRLAQEIMLNVRSRGFAFVCGRCYESRRAVAFYPFIDAPMDLYTSCPAHISIEVPRRWPYLSCLLPDQAVPGPDLADDGEEQERLFRAVAAFVSAIADEQPVAIFLDDLHWADGGSLDLLQHLVRRTRDSRVLVVGAYRDVEVRPAQALSKFMYTLQREQLLERIPLRRLGDSGTQRLIASAIGEEEVSTEFAQLVHSSTEGNPFFTHEVLRALMERGDLYREDGRWNRREIDQITVPDTVREAIGERVGRLSNEAQEILLAASVLGQQFTFEELARLTEHEEQLLEEALNEATRVGLVHAAGLDAFSFDHSLTQSSLYADLSGRRKRRLHLNAGLALERLPDSDRNGRLAELAWHFLQAREAERALEYSILAADAAEAVFAHGDSERQLETALELCAELGDPRQGEVREKLGVVLRIQGRHSAALERLEAAAQSYRILADSEGEARVVVEIGRVLIRQGQAAAGIERIDALLRMIGPSIPRLARAELSCIQGRLLMIAGRAEESLSEVEHAAELLWGMEESQRATRILADAELRRGTLLIWYMGRPTEGRRVLEAAIHLAERTGDLDILSSLLYSLGAEYQRTGDLERALTFRRQAATLAERLGDQGATAYYLSVVGWILFIAGRWREAEVELQRSVGLALRIEASQAAATALNLVGCTYIARGDWDRAERYLQDALDIARRLGLLYSAAESEAMLAWLDRLRGEPDRALARAEPLLKQIDLDAPGLERLLSSVAMAHLERGDLGSAEAAAQQTCRIAERAAARGETFAMVYAHGTRAVVQARLGHHEMAEEALEAALTLARNLSAVWEEAMILQAYGQAQAEVGQPESARAHLQDALAIFERLDATKEIERTRCFAGHLPSTARTIRAHAMR